MKTKLFLTAIIAAFVITNVAAQTTLQLNLQKGETYNQVSKVNSDVSMSISGMSMAINTTMDQSYSFKVIDVTGDNYDLEVSIGKLAMNMNMPQMSVSYSSENPKDAISSALAEATKHFFNIKMNKLGEVLEVSNLDKLTDAAFSQNARISEMEKQQFKQLLNVDQIKTSIETATAIYPKTAVSKGDKWNAATTTTAGGITISSKVEYTLSESNSSTNKISGAMTIQSDPNAAPIYDPSMGGSVKYKLIGTGSAEITLDAKSGWITEATIKQNVKGDLQAIEAGMDIPVIITNTSIVSNK